MKSKCREKGLIGTPREQEKNRSRKVNDPIEIVPQGKARKKIPPVPSQLTSIEMASCSCLTLHSGTHWPAKENESYESFEQDALSHRSVHSFDSDCAVGGFGQAPSYSE